MALLLHIILQNGISRNQQTAPLVTFRDQLEQYAGLCLILAHIGEVIQDHQIKSVEFCEQCGEFCWTSAFERRYRAISARVCWVGKLRV